MNFINKSFQILSFFACRTTLEIVAIEQATSFKLALMRVNTKYETQSKKMFPFLVVLF